MNNKIIIINGPNLNLLGEREQSQYGSTTVEELKEICLNKSRELGLEADFAQSNIEGEIVSLIQNSRKNFNGMIINAAAFTHTSIAILDALKIFKGIIIEIHITNIHSREEFRHHSFISKVAKGIIAGFGQESYLMALDYLHKVNNKKV